MKSQVIIRTFLMPQGLTITTFSPNGDLEKFSTIVSDRFRVKVPSSRFAREKWIQFMDLESAHRRHAEMVRMWSEFPVTGVRLRTPMLIESGPEFFMELAHDLKDKHPDAKTHDEVVRFSFMERMRANGFRGKFPAWWGAPREQTEAAAD
jgi:hypothetical protein